MHIAAKHGKTEIVDYLCKWNATLLKSEKREVAATSLFSILNERGKTAADVSYTADIRLFIETQQQVN